MKIRNYIPVLAILLSLFANVLFAQDDTKTFNITDFDEIVISGSVNVYLEQAVSESIRVETVNYDMKDVGVEKSGKKMLKIFTKKFKKMKKNRKVDVYVSFRNLKKLKIDNASDVFGKTVVKSDKLAIETKGAADLEISVEVQELKVKTSGASNIKISGKTDKQTLVTSGASHFKGADLESKIASIKSSGASNVSLQVNERFKAKASGTSNITYQGEPKKVVVSSNGTSSITKK